jgi:ABC-type nitrate/sulfonate/bicarbonate transport system substrate-binding protein
MGETTMRKQQISRRQFAIQTAIVAGGALVASPLLPRRRARAAVPKLQVSYSKTAIHHAAFVYLAEHADRHGLSIELVNFDRYADAMVALQKNQVQLSGLGYSNLPTIVEQKMDKVHMIAGNMVGAADIVVRNGVKVENWKDYEGLKIAAPANSIGTHLLRVDAVEHGFDINKVTVVNMLPGPAALIALKQGEIDGLVAWEPWAAQAIVGGIAYTPKPRLTDNSIGAINGVLGVNLDYAETNKDAVLAFVKAMIDVDAYLTKHPDEHAKTAVSFMGIDPAVARQAIGNFTYDENIYLKPARAYAKLVFEYGLTKFDTSPRIGEAVDYHYLETATGKSRAQLGGD